MLHIEKEKKYNTVNEGDLETSTTSDGASNINGFDKIVKARDGSVIDKES